MTGESPAGKVPAPASEAARQGGGGELVVRATTLVTVLLGVVQTAAVLSPRGATGAAAVIWALALFLAGSVLFVAAFVVAAGRSRDEQVTVPGVIWLTGSVPGPVARNLRMLLAVQCAIVVVAAAIRPFTAVAFGVLAPMAGLGAIAWYGARHGVFAAHDGKDVAREAGTSVHLHDVTSPTKPKPIPPGDPDDRVDPDDFDQLFRRRRR